MNELHNLEPKQAELLVLTQFRKHLGNSNALQKLGFDIHVQINRLPDNAGRSLAKDLGKVPGKELKQRVQHNALPAFQLRAQHEANTQLAVESLGLPADKQLNEHDALMRKNYMYPKGGFTRVEVTNPVNGKVYVGEAHCHIGDIFSKRKSNFTAFGKVFRQMLTDSHLGFKQGKRIVGALACQ